MNLSKGARREQVVTVALKLIGKYGMAGLTTIAIAKEAGISEANIYRHFQNKQEIVAEAINRIGEGLQHNLETAVQSASRPIDRLRQAFQLHLQYVGQNPGIPRLLFSDDIHSNSADLRPRLLEIVSGYIHSLAHLIEQGKKDRSIKQHVDPEAAALTFIGMIQVTIIRWLLSNSVLPIEAEGMTLWDNYEKCISEAGLQKAVEADD